jgi:uncharacterized Tic20 family protein
MTEPPRPPGDGAAGDYRPGPETPPPGRADDDRTWALIAHFGGAIAMFISGGTLGWAPPLIAYLIKGQSPTVRAHAVNALNFQLFWSTISLVGYVLGVCGSFFIIGVIFFLMPLVATVVGVIFGIIAGMKAAEGEFYRYPAAPTIIK